MRLELIAFPRRIEACFTDDGTEYVVKDKPVSDPLADPMHLPEGGFGLALTLAAVDKLDYTRSPRGVNRWRFVKRLQ